MTAIKSKDKKFNKNLLRDSLNEEKINLWMENFNFFGMRDKQYS